ncbi:hypothetical protein PHLGIDRAFT_125372 [Phlebiopsis gigantea 11061_1 CR5-6]|uniref:Pre-rRNA-processing protein RIX1 n=1 Tax=Phlebiopsis gigantea (strain 11061_1 CR5-6) TaxID=745531 RepID=A0A0C3S4H5_PHLG1|nr:hypothetical protein PHLGIDRAFT_125372 [Phlebiopsis gigantea 11061_1 CR5-6]
METHPLKILLQLHVGSDANAALNLPYILSSINAEILRPSAHIVKWTTRVHSLLHSKDAAARWAGLCIALQTSIHSRQIMLESAQGWTTVVLPMCSKNEPQPTLKAVIRLLRFVFAEAVNFPEFQRHVATPNVPKFSLALIQLSEKNEDEELQVLILQTLAQLVPLYPTLHRALLSSLSNFALRYLNGSSPKPIPPRLLEAASGLYGILHYTGGKVGAANHWRKSVDDTLGFAWGAFQGLRTTFSVSGTSQHPPPMTEPSEDPILSVSLHLDRLRAAVTVLSDLLQASNPRAVALPVGSISRLCVALLATSGDDRVEGYIEPVVHSLESSIIPRIWALGCKLTEDLAKCAELHLTPHLSQLLFYVVRHLENDVSTGQRLAFLRVSSALLTHCHPLNDPTLPSRLARAVLPQLSRILALQSQASHEDSSNTDNTKSRRGKKKARAYEGDEVFKTREIICTCADDGKALLSALQVLRLLLQRSPLTTPVQSIVARTLLAIYISFPQIPSSLLSQDLSLHGRVFEAVQHICTGIGTGTGGTMSKSLGLVIGTSLQGSTSTDVLREIELMLHPRVPPLVRALPHVESLSLFRAEEGSEEKQTRLEAGLVTLEDIRETEAVPTPMSITPGSVPPTIARSQPFQIVQTPSSLYTLGDSATPSLATPHVVGPGTGPLAVSSVSFNASDPTGEVPTVIHTHVTKPPFPPPPPATSSLPAPPDPLPSSATIAPAVSVPQMSSIAVVEPRATSAAVQMNVEEDEDEPMPGIDLGSDSEED